MKKLIVTIITISITVFVKALTLDVSQCIEMAVKSSESVARARNSVKQANLQQQVARTAYLPKFAGSVTTGWNLPDSKYPEMGMTLKMRGLYMAGVNVTQPIYAGGQIIAANKLTKTASHIANDQLDKTLDDVIADAETSYWSYVAVLSKLEMMNRYKELIDTVYNQSVVSLNAGMSTNNDLLRIEARRSQIDYQLQQVVNGADLCRMALCNTIGVDTDTPIQIADNDIPLDVPVNMDIYDIDNRPEIRMLMRDIDIKHQQANITRAEFLPTIGLQAGWSAYGNIRLKSMVQDSDGNYHPYNQNIKNNNFNVLLSLQVPLFHWGEGYKKTKAARIDVANSQLALTENRRLIDLQVQQAITNLRTNLKLLESAQVAMNQADASLSATSTSYSAGISTLTDMLDAQSQWHTSRANLIEARTNLRISVVDYLHVTAQLPHPSVN